MVRRSPKFFPRPYDQLYRYLGSMACTGLVPMFYNYILSYYVTSWDLLEW